MNTANEVNDYARMAEIYAISYIDDKGVHQVSDQDEFSTVEIIFLDGRSANLTREEYGYLNGEVMKQINKARVQ